MTKPRPTDRARPNAMHVHDTAGGLSRRAVCSGACALFGLAFLLPRDANAQNLDLPVPGGSRDPDGKVTQAAAEYVAVSAKEKVCAGCINYQKPTGTCERVAGEIEPAGWCKLWQDA